MYLIIFLNQNIKYQLKRDHTGNLLTGSNGIFTSRELCIVRIINFRITRTLLIRLKCAYIDSTLIFGAYKY